MHNLILDNHELAMNKIIQVVVCRWHNAHSSWYIITDRVVVANIDENSAAVYPPLHADYNFVEKEKNI